MLSILEHVGTVIFCLQTLLLIYAIFLEVTEERDYVTAYRGDRFARWLYNKSLPLQWFLFFFSKLAITLPVVVLITIWPGLDNGKQPLDDMRDDIVFEILFAAILVPAIETLLAQWAVIRVLKDKFHLSWKLIFVCASILFGIEHAYSFSYVIWATMAGAVLIYGYALLRHKNPFLFIYSIHAAFNLASVLTVTYFHNLR